MCHQHLTKGRQVFVRGRPEVRAFTRKNGEVGAALRVTAEEVIFLGGKPWALAGATVLLTLAGVLPGGDMKGLVAMALLDPRLYLLAWLGTGVVYLLWRLLRRERRMPGYVGFVMGVAVGWWMLARLTLF